jgi:uncharacterized membrane protein YkoI
MKFKTSILTLALISLPAFAATDFTKAALKLVPGGSVQAVKKDEVIVKTPAGTFVEIEFNRDGTLDEASGDMAQKDVFVPGNGLLSLADAVAAMKKEGKEVSGEWNLDKDFMREWEYEFEGMENGKSMEYTMNAKTGKLIKSEFD